MKILNPLRYKLIKLGRRLGYVFPERLRYDRWVQKYFYLFGLYQKIENVEGEIVECGVAYGETLITLGILAKREGKGRTVYGLDSFEGFPEPTSFDSSPREPKKGQFSDGTMRLVERQIEKADIPNPVLIKGFLCDTVPSLPAKKIAFLHIDVDMYEGYRDALTLYDRVSPGGVIAFDEYDRPNWPGATKAIDEFLKKTRETLQQDKYSGKYFFIKK